MPLSCAQLVSCPWKFKTTMNREVPEGLKWGKPSVIVSGFSSLGSSSSSLGLRGCAPQGLGWWLLPEFKHLLCTVCQQQSGQLGVLPSWLWSWKFKVWVRRFLLGPLSLAHRWQCFPGCLQGCPFVLVSVKSVPTEYNALGCGPDLAATSFELS